MKNNEMKPIKSIGILTSGGDGPGMNAAIRALTRSALGAGLRVYGIQRGYAGLLSNNIQELNASSVGNILQRGGTILYASRCPEFMEKANRAKAVQTLKDRDIDALVVIGGDGSYKGANSLNEEFQFPVMALPGTIDNDIAGTEYTLGFDTAVNTAMEAVDKIRDTAASNERNFLIEVMGANSSAIAIKVGICTGAENVLLPNIDADIEKIAEDIRRGIRRGKNSSIIIVAEGKIPGRSYHLADELANKYKIESKVCILGHIQRGGSPAPNDRLYGALMGKAAIDALMEGKYAHAVVVNQSRVEVKELKSCAFKSDHVFRHLIGVTEALAI